MADRILVVGGHGAVGAVVTRTLERWYPGRVIPAGRSAAVRVDVTDPAGFVQVLDRHRVGAVVLCVEPPDAEVARACLDRGVHLVDVGATEHLLAQVERLRPEGAATAVLSVGLVPGLSNVLARRTSDELGGADRIDIAVLLGAGERHGADAVRWTIAQLAAERPRTGTRRIALPGHGPRVVHPFPFSDQHTLRRTLGVGDVSTRLCLDSAPVTALLFGLRRAGLARAARSPRVLRALTTALTRVHLGGGDGFAVRVDAHRGDERRTYAVTGRAQSRATGLVAAHVTRELLTGGLPTGVHHLDQLDDLASLPERLAPDGIRLWTAQSDGTR